MLCIYIYTHIQFAPIADGYIQYCKSLLTLRKTQYRPAPWALRGGPPPQHHRFSLFWKPRRTCQDYGTSLYTNHRVYIQKHIYIIHMYMKMDLSISPVSQCLSVDHFAQLLGQIRQNCGPDLIKRVPGSVDRKIGCVSFAIFILPTVSDCYRFEFILNTHTTID